MQNIAHRSVVAARVVRHVFNCVLDYLMGGTTASRGCVSWVLDDGGGGNGGSACGGAVLLHLLVMIAMLRHLCSAPLPRFPASHPSRDR